MQWQFWIIRERINPDTDKVYTEEESKHHIKTFRKTNFEYWLKMCDTFEEAEEKYEEFKEHSRNLLRGQHIKNKGRDDMSTTQIKYWMKKGYSREESVDKIKERQNTFTIEKCIKKYGDEEGRRIYLDRQVRWQSTIKNKEDQSFHRLKSLSLEMFIERGMNIDDYCNHRKNKDKSDEYLLRKTKEYIISNGLSMTGKIFNQYYYRFKRDLSKKRGFASKESLRYFIPLYKFCRKNGIDRNDIMLGLSGSKEFVISRNIPTKGKRGNKSRTFRFDFTIISKKLIFEYNHIDFHPDPDIMGDKFDNFIVPLSNMSAKEKYDYDKLKMRTAREHGYHVNIIWSHKDYQEQMKMVRQIIGK